MWEGTLFTRRERTRFGQGRQIEVLLKHNVVTGATMALRRRLVGWVLPIPEVWAHDGWIALLACAAGSWGILVDEPLIKYRQHTTQVIGGKRLGAVGQLQKARLTQGAAYAREQTRFLMALERLESKSIGNNHVRKAIDEKVRHLTNRKAVHDHRSSGRTRRVLRELITGRYHRLSNGWRSLAKDLFLQY
jgi:hypothetical protein